MKKSIILLFFCLFLACGNISVDADYPDSIICEIIITDENGYTESEMVEVKPNKGTEINTDYPERINIICWIEE